MLIDIVILPSFKRRKTLGDFDSELKKQFRLKWVVDNKKLIPHVSLFHIRIDKKNLSKVVNEVKQIAKNFQKLPIVFTKARGHYPYFSVGVLKSSKLYTLHKQVVNTLKDLRKGEMPFIHPPVTVLAKNYARKYGAIGIFKKYSPHVTLGSVKAKDNFLELLNKINKDKKLFKNFIANEIVVAEVDKYWQVYKIIKTFKLKPAKHSNTQ